MYPAGYKFTHGLMRTGTLAGPGRTVPKNSLLAMLRAGD